MQVLQEGCVICLDAIRNLVVNATVQVSQIGCTKHIGLEYSIKCFIGNCLNRGFDPNSVD